MKCDISFLRKTFSKGKPRTNQCLKKFDQFDQKKFHPQHIKQRPQKRNFWSSYPRYPYNSILNKKPRGLTRT